MHMECFIDRFMIGLSDIIVIAIYCDILKYRYHNIF